MNVWAADSVDNVNCGLCVVLPALCADRCPGSLTLQLPHHASERLDVSGAPYVCNIDIAQSIGEVHMTYQSLV